MLSIYRALCAIIHLFMKLIGLLFSGQASMLQRYRLTPGTQTICD